MTSNGAQHDKTQSSNSMMDGHEFSDDQILEALLKSHIVDNLQEAEIKILADLISGQYLKGQGIFY